MTVDALHIDFNTKFQNIGTQSYGRLLDDHIDWLLNDQMMKLIRSLYNNRYVNEEKNVRYRAAVEFEVIEPIVRSHSGTIDSNNRLTLTSDHYLIIPDSVNADVTFKNRNFRLQPCRMIDIGKLGDLLNDYHTTTMYNSPIVYLDMKSIKVETEGIRDNFIINNLHYKYIKKPNLINKVSGVTCELAEACHDLLVDNAVSFAKQLIHNNMLDSTVNQQINME